MAPTLACGMSLSWFSMESINVFTTLLTVWCGPHTGLWHVSQLVLHGVCQRVHNSTHCLVWPPHWPVACLSAGSPWSLSTCSQLYSLSGVAPTLACRMSLSWFSIRLILWSRCWIWEMTKLISKNKTFPPGNTTFTFNSVVEIVKRFQSVFLLGEIAP